MKIRVLISMAAIMATFLTFGATPVNRPTGTHATAPELPELILHSELIPVDSKCETVIVADLNGDNRDDFAVTTTMGESQGSQDYSILLYFQQQNGTISNPTELSGGNGLDLCATDINGDTLNDLVFSGNSGVGIRYQLTSGMFSDIIWLSGFRCDRIAVGDINGDSRPDILSMDTELPSYSATIYRQTSGGFSRSDSGYVFQLQDIRITDVSGDGRSDIAYLGINGRVAVALQRSNGTLNYPVYGYSGIEGTGIALTTGNIDLDAQSDLAATIYQDASTSSVEFFYGANDFPASTSSITLPNHFQSLDLSDLNLDGRSDLVTTFSGGGALGIYLQSPSGDFESAGSFAAPETSGSGIRALSTGDLNGDGMPDIVLVDADNGITLYRQRAKLLLPHIATEAQWDTYIVLTNVGSVYSDAVVTMYNPNSGNRYRAFYVYPGKSVYAKLPSGTCGIVEYTGGNLVAREVFVNVEEDGQGVAEFLLNGNQSPAFDIPLPAYNGDNLTWMGIAVFNPADETVTAHLEAISGSGVTLGTTEIDIPAQERAVGILDTFFPEIDYFNIARIRVTSTHSLTGLAISGQGNEKLLFAPAAHNHSGGRLYLPHIAQVSEGWTSWMVVDNTTSDSQTVTLTVTGDGGELGSFIYLVNARSSRLISLDDLIPNQELVEAGWVDVPEGVLAREVFINTENNGGGTAEFLLSTETTPYLVLGYPWYAADVMTWWGLAVYNPTAYQQTVIIRASDANGQIRAASVDIGPYSRFRTLLDDLYPALDPSTVARITIEGSHILTGLNISGAGTSRLLFAPAAAR